jgi:hypothetical protein
MNMLGLSWSVRIALLACCRNFFLLHYIQVLCQYRLCKADHAYLTYLMLQRQFSHLNGRKLDHRQVSFRSLHVALGLTAQENTLSPTVLLLMLIYSLCSNGSLVRWRNSMFSVAFPGNGWRLLLSYSVMSQYLPSVHEMEIPIILSFFVSFLRCTR